MQEATPGVRNGQEGLVCWDSQGHKQLDITEWLNWTDSHIGKQFANIGKQLPIFNNAEVVYTLISINYQYVLRNFYMHTYKDIEEVYCAVFL